MKKLFQIFTSLVVISVTLAEFILPGATVKAAPRHDDPPPCTEGGHCVYSDDSNPDLVYTGTGWTPETYPNVTNVYHSETSGDKVALTFTGNRIIFWTEKAQNAGIVNIWLDSSLVDTYDAYNSGTNPVDGFIGYDSGLITFGEHTIEIGPSGTANPSATGSLAILHAFEWFDNPPPIELVLQDRSTYFTDVMSLNCSVPLLGQSSTIVCSGNISGNDGSEFYGVGAIFDSLFVTSETGTAIDVYYYIACNNCIPFLLSENYPDYYAGCDIDLGTFPDACSGIKHLNNTSFGDNGIRIRLNNSTTGPYRGPVGGSYLVMVSTIPLNNCVSSFQVQGTNTYDVDPVIETPLGPEGFPADEQIANIIPGNIYKLETKGIWNDGGADRTDFAMSFDGETWTPIAQIADTLCRDGTAIYFTASFDPLPFGQNKLYIRVNDTAGNFSDNTEAEPVDDPLQYVLSEVIQVAPVACSQKFTYDPDTDLLASGTIPATNSFGVYPSATLTPGDWYVVETTDGPWYEGSAPTAGRYDIQLSVDSSSMNYGQADDWSYTDCSEFTGSAAHKRYYFQAAGSTFFMRVNDQNSNFSDNTGSLGYNLYHVSTYTYWPSECETTFTNSGEVPWSIVYNANQDAGVNLVPTGQSDLVTQNWIQGQWYMLETTGGPWLDDSPHINRYSADFSSTVGTPDWQLIEDWPGSSCTVHIDKLGHVRIYFQNLAPQEFYKIRVHDDDFPGNLGSMGARLYKVTNSQVLPPGSEPVEGACNGTYSVNNLQASQPVNPQLSGGVYVPHLTEGGYYALETAGYWEETGEGGSDFLSSAEISDDNGASWHTWKDYPSMLCLEAFDSGISGVIGVRIFIKAEPGRQYKVRANDVDANWPNNNDSGDFGINIYDAVARIDPWNTCTTNYSIVKIQSHNVVYSHLGGAGDAQRLDIVPGELYALEILPEAGWYEGSSGPNFDYQLSFDDGDTWHPWTDSALPGTLCAAHFPQGSRLYFVAPLTMTYARIRVNDQDNDFTNNSGEIYYDLYAGQAGDPNNPGSPDVTIYLPPAPVADCYSWPVRPSGRTMDVPTAPTAPGEPGEGLDIVGWTQYLIDWIIYIGNSVVYSFNWTLYYFSIFSDIPAWLEYGRTLFTEFFLWCPEHTEAIIAMMDAIQQREPFATLDRIDAFYGAVQTQIEAYSWVDSNAPAVPFSGASGGDQAPSILPTVDDTSPWASGGTIQWNPDLGGGGSGLTSCSAKITITLGTSGMAAGFCVVMNLIKMFPLIQFIFNALIVVASIASFLRYLGKRFAPLIDPTALLTGSRK